ncbi:InlB B-repeat-containing protein [Infirmifilum sp. NZ]|uniref:InlB B-repeat-containing protein n=1 Tax=Infirmifilum sp. NZ TaxID=2926850 RepID=UPI002DBDF707|nr:hypothetical protein [Infirmifilum sp. NZ]
MLRSPRVLLALLVAVTLFISNYSTAGDAYTVRFWIAPSYIGASISFAGSTYTSGSSASFPAGTYPVSANVPSGYIFLAWVTRAMVGLGGGVKVTGMRSQSTTATVYGSDDLVAVIVWPVRLRGRVTAYNTKPFAVGPTGRIAFQVKVDEVLQDVSGRFSAGDTVEVWVKTGSSYASAVGVGDYVEVYGYGYDVDLSWVPLSPRRGVLVENADHYVNVLEKAPPSTAPSPSQPATPHVGVRFATGEPAVGVEVYVNGELRGYTDSQGTLQVSVSSNSVAYSKTVVYAAGAVINYEGSCSLSPGGSCTITLVPREGCIIPLTRREVNATAVEGGIAAVQLSWVFAKCSPNSQVLVAAYDANGSRVSVLWDGGDAGYTHSLITRTLNITRPGTYIVKAVYAFPPSAPGEGIIWVITASFLPREGGRVSLRTEPPGVGYVAIGNESLRDGSSIVLRKGRYPLYASAPDGFVFYRWRVSGNATVSEASAANTTLNLAGDAEITAVFAWPLRLRGRVTQLSLNDSGFTMRLTVEEVFTDPSGLAGKGDTVEAVALNLSLVRVEGYGGAGDISVGDAVEVAGTGLWSVKPPGYMVVLGPGSLLSKVSLRPAVSISVGLLQPPLLAASPLGFVPVGQEAYKGGGAVLLPAGSPTVIGVRVLVNGSAGAVGCSSLKFSVFNETLKPIKCELEPGGGLTAYLNVTAYVGNYTLRAIADVNGTEVASDNAVAVIGYVPVARSGRAFSVVRDAYRFASWTQGGGDAKAYLEAALRACPVNSTLFKSLMSYLLAGPDYSLGVASTLAGLFTGSLKVPQEAYILSKAQVEQLVVEHQFKATIKNLAAVAGSRASTPPASLFEEVKRRVDAGTPPIMLVGGHALLVIGYYDAPAARLLVAYDPGKPNSTLVIELSGGAFRVPGLGSLYSGVQLVEPALGEDLCALLGQAREGVVEILRRSVMVGFSNVGRLEASGAGGVIIVEAGAVLQNSINGSAVLSSQSTGALLLPADGNYTLKVAPAGPGARLVVASVAGERIIVANYTLTGSGALTLSKASLGAALVLSSSGAGASGGLVKPTVELYTTRGDRVPAGTIEEGLPDFYIILAPLGLAAAVILSLKLVLYVKVRRSLKSSGPK